MTIPLPGSTANIITSFGCPSLAFEPNVGQVDPEVQFLARGPGYQLFLTHTEAVISLTPRPEVHPLTPTFALREGRDDPTRWTGAGDGAAEGSALPTASSTTPQVLRMKLIGADSPSSIEADQPLRGRVNYFIGNDPIRWRTNITTFAKVQYREVYPGTDLVYYGSEGRLEYDFVLAPGANPDRIALQFEGADQIELDGQGDLIAWVAGHAVRWQKPVIYQEINGRRIEIAGAYRLNGDSLVPQTEASREIGFQVAAYDRSRPLVIDPVLVYSTYFGGDGGTDPSPSRRMPQGTPM